MAARDALIRWANGAGSSLTVIGHSLGGALAQWFAADFTSQGGKLAEVETFNSPGIAKSTSSSVKVAASMFKSANCGYVKHHITNGDIVSMFGDEFINGTVYLYTVADISVIGKHMTALDPKSLSKTITSAALSSSFFHYDGEFLNTIASLSNVNPALTGFAPLLFFRCTAEGARSAIGKFTVDKLPVISSNSVHIVSIPSPCRE